MLKFITLRDYTDFNDQLNQEQLVDFMYKHLDKFGDPKPAISKSIDYAFSKSEGKGGYIVLGYDNEELIGAVIMNDTGMKDYIPENILVYVAVKADQRGKGFGGKLINKAIEQADGDVALHVEYDNPAKRLYERLGFESKYAEMRFTK